MKRLKNIAGYLSTEELGKALMRHAKLMNESLNSTNSCSKINNIRLNGMRALCELYEKYNLNLKILEENKIKEEKIENKL